MTFENGTLILADWTAKVKDTGQLIETTKKADAESAGQADPTRVYEPRLVAVGEGWVLKGFDEALAKADLGQKLEIDLPPEKAFGQRDISKISRIPTRKFGEKASELNVGAEVEVDNRVGIIRSLESGRVMVDFNPRYAGKTLLYNFEVKERLDSNDAKIAALIRRRLAIDKDKLKFDSSSDEVKITIPGESFLTEGLQIIKRGISSDLFKYVKSLERVSFIETFENPSAKKEEPKPQETPAPLPEAKTEQIVEKPSAQETAKVEEPAEKIAKSKDEMKSEVKKEKPKKTIRKSAKPKSTKK